MGTSTQSEIDAWLRRGGIVIAASERAARAMNLAFHRARVAEGLKAWPAPEIHDWNAFVRAAWLKLSTDSLMVLNSIQEQSIWAQIAAADGHLATQLEAPLHRLASLAMSAHELLCSHAPRALRTAARSGWQSDAGAFSGWLASFDQVCRNGALVSPARLPLQLITLLERPASDYDGTGTAGSARQPLLLAGFDRILPHQRAVFNAWGNWQELGHTESAEQLHFHACADAQAELAACARWCSRELATRPDARILVIAQNTSAQRGQIERAFLTASSPDPAPAFEFSLGIPLGKTDLPRAAHMLLRWLSGPLAEHEIDWLFSTRYLAGPHQSSALQAHMRAIRAKSLQQPDWTLKAFMNIAGPVDQSSNHDQWTTRILTAQRQLEEKSRRPRSPLDWSELIPPLLDSIGFASSQNLGSLEFQALRRWRQALETAGSLGFDGRRIAWHEFLSVLARTLDDTLFAPESRNAPIQIAGPAESAGLTADAIWFLGATEEAWPAPGATQPLIPADLQRETAMPHSTAQLDWDLALATTTRLIASAPVVHFSYARQSEGAESRPARLISQLAGAAQPLPAEFSTRPASTDQTELIEDFSRIPLPTPAIDGGSAVLTAQSQCPFKAFATARLGAHSWESAEAGLTASQRGQLLHDVLHSIWTPPGGIRTHAELINRPDRRGFVADHVHRVFETRLRPNLRDRMPARYLALEEQRLTRLVTEWLDYEATRQPFEVLQTERKHTRSVAGLSLDLRLDRLDKLNDGSVFVIDYKSGNVSPSSWDPPRAEDVQLPLYARFALEADQTLGGLAFAKVRPGDLVFAGCIGDPAATLFSDLKSNSALAKNALSFERLMAWEESIEQLARDFLAGHAEVDPRDYPKTCERCGLQSLCRIQEHQIAVADDDEDESGAASQAGSLDD